MSKQSPKSQSSSERYESHKHAISEMTGDYIADRRQRGDYKTTEEQAKRAVMEATKKIRRDAGEE